MKNAWKKYPDEKPSKKDRYLVTLDDGNGHQHISIATFYMDTFWENGAIDNIVTAWQELPPPFVDPEKNTPNYWHPDEITARKYVEGDPETLRRLGIFD